MLSFFLSYLLIYKYAILFCVVSTASFGIPIPATALIMAAGAFAADGYFDVTTVFVCSLFASILGDILGYSISFRHGKTILSKIGFRKILLSPKFATMEEMFAAHSISAIFYSRFLATSLGPTVNILAGLSKTSYKKFLLCDILGEILYVALFLGLGYVFGDQWEAISDVSGNIATLVVLVVILISLIVVFVRSRNETKANNA